MAYAEIIDYWSGVETRVQGGAPGLRHVLFYTTKARDAYLAALPLYQRARAGTIERAWSPAALRHGVDNGHVHIIPE